MNTKSEKEIYAYFKRVEDPANYSSERWGYLIEQWMLHGMRIEEEKEWVDDGSIYYENLISILEQCYEAPIIDFISHWQSEWEGNMTDEMETWKRMTKDNYTEVFRAIPEIKDVSDFIKGYDFVDIKHPDNWKKLEITFKESDMTQMKFRYDGEESDWINVSDYIMQRPNYEKPKYGVFICSKLIQALAQISIVLPRILLPSQLVLPRLKLF